MTGYPIWRPINTAPRSYRSDVLLWNGERVFCGWFDADEGAWVEANTEDAIEPQPTHWMPMPAPPGSLGAVGLTKISKRMVDAGVSYVAESGLLESGLSADHVFVRNLLETVLAVRSRKRRS